MCSCLPSQNMDVEVSMHVPVYAKRDASPTCPAASPQNLDVDLAPWREPRRRANLTVWGMAAWVRERLPPRNSQRWVLMRAGRVLTLGKAGKWVDDCERPCDPIMYDIYNSKGGLRAATRALVTEPSVL